MKITSEILDLIAHIDRNLFPKEFYENMGKLRVNKEIAYSLYMELKLEKSLGIINLWQNNINLEEEKEALLKYINWFKENYNAPKS